MLAVLTQVDMPPARFGAFTQDESALADGVVRYVGHLPVPGRRIRLQERAVSDNLAERLGMDPVEFRMKNLRGNAATATVEDRQRVLRLIVKDILIGPEKITIRHASPPAQAAPAPGSATPNPTRRVTIAQVTHCVGGVTTPPCGVPPVGAKPLPASNTPAFSQSRIRSLAGNDPRAARR